MTNRIADLQLDLLNALNDLITIAAEFEARPDSPVDPAEYFTPPNSPSPTSASSVTSTRSSTPTVAEEDALSLTRRAPAPRPTVIPFISRIPRRVQSAPLPPPTPIEETSSTETIRPHWIAVKNQRIQTLTEEELYQEGKARRLAHIREAFASIEASAEPETPVAGPSAVTSRRVEPIYVRGQGELHRPRTFSNIPVRIYRGREPSVLIQASSVRVFFNQDTGAIREVHVRDNRST